MARAQHRVAYYHDEMVGTIYYGQQHPMKPHRVAMTHNLVVNYKMDEQMDVFVSCALASSVC
jgi:acetoin utilization deacetylase AcuC-like enzyme